MKQFPQPKFPAQDAWKNMQEILNNEMPVEEKRKKRFAFLWMLGLMLVASGTYLYITKNDIVTINKNSVKINVNNASTLNTTTERAEKTNTKTISTNESYTTKNNVEKASNYNVTDNNNIFKNNTNDAVKKLSANNNNILKLNKENTSNKYYKSFKDGESFADIKDLKIARGEKVTHHLFANADANAQANTDENATSFVENQNINSIEKAIEKSAEKTSSNNVVKVPRRKSETALHYGLQWNVVLPQTNSYLNYNAQSQPLTIAIPEFWVSKSIGRKSELSLQLNPYSQYTLKNQNILISKDYATTITQGSGQNPTTVNYNRTHTLVKVIGVELSVKYTYKLNDKFSIAAGIGNSWTNAAVVNDRIKGVGDKVVHDSLYGIAKGFNDWNYLKSSFIVGRFEALYQLKKLQIGVAFLKPFGNLYSFSNNNTNPVNSRLVLRWSIK